MRFSIYIFGIIVLFATSSCLKPEEYPREPQIKFVSMTKTEVVQNQRDSFDIVFSFTDGDGDLGSNENVSNVFLTDTRSGFEEYAFKIPEIPQQGATNGISGEVTITVLSSCCVYDTTGVVCVSNSSYSVVDLPFDEMSYEIVVKDRAGNTSNIIETPVFRLNCEY